MKKFTRLWQLMMILLLTSSVAIGQKQFSAKEKQMLDNQNTKNEQMLKMQKASTSNEEQITKLAAEADILVEKIEGQEVSVIKNETDPNANQQISGSALPLGSSNKSVEQGKAAVKLDYVKDNAGNSAGIATPNPNIKPLPYIGNPTDGGVAYAFDFAAANAISFDSDVPGTFTTIGPNTNQAFAGDYDVTGTWYYIDYGTLELYTVDPGTGVSTLVAAVTGLTGAQSPSGMACDKNTGIMYVSSTDITASDIYTIDLSTGALTLLGSSGMAGCIEIAVDGHGTMYGWDLVTDASFTIDKTTGLATLIGPLGIDLNYAQGGNYDPINNEVYLFAYSGTGGLYKLNRANGMANLVGGFQGGAEIDGGGFPGLPAIPTTDGGATWVTAPSNGVLSNTEVIEATIFNYGSTALSNFNVQYTINAGTPVVENIAGPIAPGTGIVYAFATTADLSAPGDYTIEVCASVTGDAVAANDCSSKTVTSFAPFDCNWYVIGEDAYGDGWNGGYIDIYSNGVLINSWAGPATTGPDQYDFGIYEGETLDFVWNSGSWDSEVTYTVYNNFDVPQFSQGPNPVTVNGIAATCLPPPCPVPSGTSTSQITLNSARANWVPGGSETLWNFEWGPAGFTLGTGNLTTGWTNPNPLGGDPYFNITGLNSSAGYDWYVQADCGTDDVSPWLGPFTFSTLVDNDDCANATPIGEVVDMPVSNVNATASGVIPTCGGSTAPMDIWYAYTATMSGNGTIDLCGSSFDTRIAVYDACAGTELACNDDFCSLQSSVDLSITSGTTYYIQVGGYNAGIGTGDLSVTVVPVPIVSELLYQYDVEAITGEITLLAPEYFNGSLWVTGAAGAVAGDPKYIYEIDYTNGTLVNSYPQGTTTAWGMRDMANDGTYLYASDENGFYSIDPTNGTVATVFDNTAAIFGVVSPLRALAYDGTNFWTKSFGGDVYSFDMTGAIVAGPFVNAASAYGAAYDPTVPCIWWHATGGASGNNMVQMLLDGTFTGATVEVPVGPCGPPANSVGGAFLDFGNMYTGRNVFGVLDQTTPDVVKIFEYNDTGFPDQSGNYMPMCGAFGEALDGSLTWDFGANTDTYDLWFGLAGAMTQVVTGASAGATGSYPYTGLLNSTTYEWQVVEHNTTGTTMGEVLNFTTAAPPAGVPFAETFEVQADPAGWVNTSSNPVANGIWEYGNATTNTPGYTVAGTPDHTGTGGFYAWADGSTPVVPDMTLITPFIDASSLSVPYLEFFLLSNNGTTPGDNCTFYCDFWDGAAWNNLLTYAGDAPDWQQYSFDLSGYTITGNVQFRFIVDQTTAVTAFYNDILLDDIWFGEAPTCPDPTQLSATNIGVTSADLAWTETGTATQWDLYIDVTGGPAPDPGTTPTVDNTTNNPYPFTGTMATTYDAWVRADCGGDVSAWVGPVTFTLNCTTMPAGAQLEGEECGMDINGGCNMAVPAFTTITPGTPIYGKTWADGGNRDTDWFELTVPNPFTQVTMEILSSDIEVIYGLIETATPGSPDCGTASSINPNAIAAPCTPSSLDIMIDQPGTYWFFIGHTDYYNYPCWNEPAGYHYVANWTLTEFNGPVAAIDPTDIEATLPVGGTATADVSVSNSGDYELSYDAMINYAGQFVVTVVPQSANYWTGSTDGSTKTDVSMVNGYDTEDGWFMFDISAIPAGATVTNIEFVGYVNNTYYPYWSMTPLTADPLTADAATLYADINAEATTSALCYLYQNESSTFAPGLKQYTLGGTANADLTAAISQGWFAMGMASRDNSTTYYIDWDGWNDANPPSLIVTYSTGAPTGWLSIDGVQSLSGVVPPAGETIHEVAFDATGIAEGTYYADIDFTTNEIVKTSYTVACTLNVVANGYDVMGQLTYGTVANPAKPMDYVTIDLMDGPVSMGQYLTDLTGNFMFSNIPDGSYTYRASTTKAAGGVTASDLFAVNQYLLLAGSLSPLQQLAGDLNWDGPGNVTAGDLFILNQYLLLQIGLGDWAAPNYVFEDVTVNVSGGNVVSPAADFQSLCSGDVDGSFTPPSSTPVTVFMETFDTELPATWSQVQYSGTGTWYWTNTTTSFLGSDGSFVQANDDETDLDYDVGLFTPAIDVSGYAGVDLVFDRNFQDFAGYGYATVNVYSGGTGAGNFEEELLFLTDDDPGGTGTGGGVHTTLNFDPSGYADPSNVYIEFYYNDEAYAGGWFIKLDNVEVIGVP